MRAVTTTNAPNRAGSGAETHVPYPLHAVVFANQHLPIRTREPPHPHTAADDRRATPFHPNQSARPASVVTPTASTNATTPNSGTAPQPSYPAILKAASLIITDLPSAATGKDPTGAIYHTNPPNTNVRDAAIQSTELKSATKHRRARALTPYNPEAWHRHLDATGLTLRYPSIYSGSKKCPNVCMFFTKVDNP